MNLRDTRIAVAYLKGWLSEQDAADALGLPDPTTLGKAVEDAARAGYRSARRELAAQGRELPAKPPARETV